MPPATGGGRGKPCSICAKQVVHSLDWLNKIRSAGRGFAPLASAFALRSTHGFPRTEFVEGFTSSRPAHPHGDCRLGLASDLCGGEARTCRPSRGGGEERRGAGGSSEPPCAVPSPADANARQPGNSHRAWGPPLRFDSSRRGTENWCAGIRESLLAHDRQPLAEQRLRSNHLFPSNRAD